MAQLKGDHKKHQEALQDVAHDGAEQTVDAKEKRKKATLFGSSKKKEKQVDSKSDHLAEEKLKEEEACMYTLLSAKLSEKAALDTELQSVKDELRREVEEKETLHACNEGLRARQREMSDQLEAVEAELRRSQEEDAVLATLAAKLREKASLKVQLEAARDELARERADSLEQLTGVEAKLRAALEEIENLRREVSTMRTELDRKEGERSEVEVELRRERGERATLVERLSSMEDELKASEEKRAVLYSELKTVQKEKELLQQSILQDDKRWYL